MRRAKAMTLIMMMMMMMIMMMMMMMNDYGDYDDDDCADDDDDNDDDDYDDDRFKQYEVKAWNRGDAHKLIESGIIQTEFNVIATLSAWADDDSEDEKFDNITNEELEDFEGFDSLMGEGGLLANILYDENTILENSVPVSSLTPTGRNEPCPCGSGKKYKKCCLQ